MPANRWIPGQPQIDDSKFARDTWMQRLRRALLTMSRVKSPIITASANLELEYFYPVDCTSGAVTLTLPAANLSADKQYCIKKIDASANGVTVAASGTDTIDGAASISTTTRYGTVFLVSDGISAWYVIAASAAGGSGTTSPLTTKGDIWVYSTTDTRLPVGTDGYLLTSDSTQTTGLKWNAANTLTAGCLILLSQQTVSGAASINFTSLLTSGYDEYIVDCYDLVNATNSQALQFLASTDNGATWLGGTTYMWGGSSGNEGATVSGIGSGAGAGLAAMQISNTQANTATNFAGTCTLRLMGANSSSYKHLYFSSVVPTSSTPNMACRVGGGPIRTTSAVNAIQLKYASGNISGTAVLYGVAKSSNQMLMNPGVALTTAGSGSVSVPTGVQAARIRMVAAGGAGGGSAFSATKNGGGGGAGETAEFTMKVTGGSTLDYTVGAKGTGAAGAVGGDGGNTSIGPSGSGTTYIVLGGKGGKFGASGTNGGAGGGRLGATGGSGSATPTAGGNAATEGVFASGGAAGGGAGNVASNVAGAAGGASEQYSGGAGGTIGTGSGGGGGAASAWGPGGAGQAAGGNATGTSAASTSYGAGGGGCGGASAGGPFAGGNGCDGAIFIQWL